MVTGGGNEPLAMGDEERGLKMGGWLRAQTTDKHQFLGQIKVWFCTVAPATLGSARHHTFSFVEITVEPILKTPVALIVSSLSPILSRIFAHCRPESKWVACTLPERAFVCPSRHFSTQRIYLIAVSSVLRSPLPPRSSFVAQDHPRRCCRPDRQARP